MKLLTLEEIEAIENSAKENNDQWNETVLRLEKVVGLLATARAYWEVRNKIETALRIENANDAIIEVYRALDESYGSRIAGMIEEDKPHARTIEAVIDAIRRITYTTKLGKVTAIDATEAIKSLKKHLE